MYLMSDDPDSDYGDSEDQDLGDPDSDETDSGDPGFVCAGCGQWNETSVDASAGRRQTYVEDCQVCCKPNVLHIEWDHGEEAYRIEAELES